jgi:hypothetical protein
VTEHENEFRRSDETRAGADPVHGRQTYNRDLTTDSDFPADDARTMRSHAGEALTDSKGWPGYFFLGLGLLLLGLTLVAAGYGFEGWAWIAGPACIVSFAVGAVLVMLERKRVRDVEGTSLREPRGH